jgi:hypothetical protein
MDYQEFKDKLMNYCSLGGLYISKDNNGIYLKLNFDYLIFSFDVRNLPTDTPGFKYRLSDCNTEEFSEKIVSFDEELLKKCLTIANKWIIKRKKNIIGRRKSNLERDFDDDR